MSRTRVLVGAATDVGRARSHNEDTYGYRIPEDAETADHKGYLFVVCDGMGGHAAGEVASQIAVETILTTYYDEPDSPAESLKHAIAIANSRIFTQASQRSEQRGMGTTAVAIVVRGDSMTVAHAGDSRAYLLRNGELSRLTRDHSLVEEWVAKGVLPASEAGQHPMSNVITRALGHAPEVTPEVQEQPLEDGDLLLLCSDGLSGRVDDQAISGTLTTAPGLDAAVHSLIALANEAGGPDNISVIVIRVESPTAVTKPSPIPAGDTIPGEQPRAAEQTLNSDPLTATTKMRQPLDGFAPAGQDVPTTKTASVPPPPTAEIRVQQRPRTPAQRTTRGQRRWIVLAAAVIVVLLLIGVVALIVLFGIVGGRPPFGPNPALIPAGSSIIPLLGVAYSGD